jgi:hypothetical protein
VPIQFDYRSDSELRQTVLTFRFLVAAVAKGKIYAGRKVDSVSPSFPYSCRRIIIKESSRGVAEATTCLGSFSIIHEGNDSFAVTVINPNDRDEGGLDSPEKWKKNMEATRPSKKKKTQNKRKMEEIAICRPGPIKAGQDADVTGSSPEKTSPLFSVFLL